LEAAGVVLKIGLSLKSNHHWVIELAQICEMLWIRFEADTYFKQNEKILAAHLNELRGPPVEKHCSRPVFLNWWAVDNFQWASNLVILLSFTAKLYNFIIIQH
jgi:hypothetical protein